MGGGHHQPRLLGLGLQERGGAVVNGVVLKALGRFVAFATVAFVSLFYSGIRKKVIRFWQALLLRASMMIMNLN